MPPSLARPGPPSSCEVIGERAPRLAPPSAGRCFDTVDYPDRVPRLPDALLRSERWSLIVEGAWKQPAAIHLLEGRIALAGLRHHSRTAEQHGQRVLSPEGCRDLLRNFQIIAKDRQV